MSIHESLLVCPKCQTPFTELDSAYTCPVCWEDWSNTQGLLIAPDHDSSYYYGELPRLALQHILHRASAVGPTQALEEWCGYNWDHYLYRYALDPRRALFLEFLDLRRRPRVLDYGCGFGSLGLAAASIADEVLLVDSVIERCLFAQQRAIEMGYSNTVGIVTSDWRNLPIAKHSLDLVILNGVLEWIPETTPGNPLEVQLEFLKGIKGLLRQGGAIFLGIENRFALRYFRGYPDDHTNTRFTSLMPRSMADLYCRWRFGRQYRTLTWSYRDYQRQLTQLGYKQIDFIYLDPDYRFPERACVLSDTDTVRMILRQHHDNRMSSLTYSILHRLGVLHFFVYSYGIIGYV